MTTIHRYLERYGHAQPPAFEFAQTFEHSLVVPVYAESPHCLARLLARLPQPTLVICVVNQPADAPPAMQFLNRRFLRSHGVCERASPRRVTTASCVHEVVVLDMTTDPATAAEGVGRARKIGLDTALLLQQQGVVRSNWLHTTDADAVLPANYFEIDYPERGLLLYPFVHQASRQELVRAARLYEAHLEVYRQGLARAGSPYAFTALGSAMAVNAEDYAAVRGMPRRNAGEDFYFANKLAKVSKVQQLEAPVISLAARTSRRVPFGTGPALRRLKGASTLHTYRAEIFAGLAELLKSFADPSCLPPFWARSIASELGLYNYWPRALANYGQPEQQTAALHTWFDGLKTLRFVHAAQRRFPDQNLAAEQIDKLVSQDALALTGK